MTEENFNQILEEAGYAAIGKDTLECVVKTCEGGGALLYQLWENSNQGDHFVDISPEAIVNKYKNCPTKYAKLKLSELKKQEVNSNTDDLL